MYAERPSLWDVQLYSFLSWQDFFPFCFGFPCAHFTLLSVLTWFIFDCKQPLLWNVHVNVSKPGYTIIGYNLCTKNAQEDKLFYKSFNSMSSKSYFLWLVHQCVAITNLKENTSSILTTIIVNIRKTMSYCMTICQLRTMHFRQASPNQNVNTYTYTIAVNSSPMLT